MRPFRSVSGVAVPFGGVNVDTDLIIPSRWMKCMTRDGLGRGAFETLRSDPWNLFDTPRNRGAPILIAGPNFGCGSSREHAPWALLDMGFKTIIAPSFADIFVGNCIRNGLAPLTLPPAQIERLMTAAQTGDVTVDLERGFISTEQGDQFAIAMDAFSRRRLLEGLDEIRLIEQYESALEAYEARVRRDRPWIGLR